MRHPGMLFVRSKILLVIEITVIMGDVPPKCKKTCYAKRAVSQDRPYDAIEESGAVKTQSP